jgi:hypothetical protein
LTTLLLVRRRVGRLPTKRAELYEESIKVLLQTWNLEAHEGFDLETAKCQLAYVAFEMMCTGTQTIGREELERLLREVRKNQTWLPTNLEAPGEFLKRVELRSSLLAKRGFRQVDIGSLEEEYEFQHLTFQEYLAAFAVVEGYYGGADDHEHYCDVLKDFYGDANKEEIILLAAAQAQRNSVTRMVTAIIEQIDSLDEKENIASKITVLRNSLMKILLDEVQLVEETRSQIYIAVTGDSMWYGQVQFIRDVLKSDNLGKEFRDFLENDWSAFVSALDVATDEGDPIGRLMETVSANDGDPDAAEKEISILSHLLWIQENSSIKKRMEKNSFLESTIGSLTSITMKSSSPVTALNSANCLLGILACGCNIPAEWIPDEFVWKLLHLFYERKKISDAISLITKLLFKLGKGLGPSHSDFSQEMKDFFAKNLPDIRYSLKEGVFWASVLVGAWSWTEAETVLEETFEDKGNIVHSDMKKKLHTLKTALENGSKTTN